MRAIANITFSMMIVAVIYAMIKEQTQTVYIMGGLYLSVVVCLMVYLNMNKNKW